MSGRVRSLSMLGALSAMVLFTVVLFAAAARPALADPPAPGMMGGGLLPGEKSPGAAGEPVPAALQVGFDQKLGGQVPLDLDLRDEEGKAVRLGDLFGGRPVILSLAYYDCPMLCGLSLQGIASSLKTLAFDAGREFEVITVSFDPKDTPERARARKTQSLDQYGRPSNAAGWRFLTGDPRSIRLLTEAVGFRYAWDEELKQFAHPTGIVVLTPAGKIARYFFGVEYAPKDLRLGLIEAADNRIGTLADKLLLLCYSYDPKTGRYSGLAIGLVRGAGLLTLLVLATGIGVALRRERRRPAAIAAARGAAGGAAGARAGGKL